MASSSSSSSTGGIGFGGALQLLFIGLKLTGYITWPWWQVLLPTLIGLGILAALLLFVGTLIVISTFTK